MSPVSRECNCAGKNRGMGVAGVLHVIAGEHEERGDGPEANRERCHVSDPIFRVILASTSNTRACVMSFTLAGLP
jgi:hypothetical protein